MMRKITKLPMSGVCLTVLALASAPAFGQSAKAAATGANTADASQTGEIIVTANKREQSANKVGVTLTALSGDVLQTRSIKSATDLAAVVPGLSLAESVHGTPVYTLRGVGYNADALGVYPAVSISLDQAPMPFPVLALHSLYDLERVEVLKGPQGTLFGQNSTGGAINYIAAKPTADLQAGATLSYGRFNAIAGTFFVSGPLTDNLRFRSVVDFGDRDGWQINRRDGSKLGQQHYIALREILTWEPSSKFSLSFDVNGSIDTSQPTAPLLIGVRPTVPTAPSAAELTAPLATGNIRVTDWSEGADLPHGDRDLFQAIVRGDYHVTDAVALTSLTTFNYLHQNMAFDDDGSVYNMVDFPVDKGTIADVSEELRLSNASQAGARWRWTLGGNYNYSHVKQLQQVIYGDNSISNAGNLFIDTSGIDNRSEINNYAAFANTEYDLTSKLTLRAGVRYTKSVNTTYSCGFSPGDGRTAVLFNILGQLLGGQNIPLTASSCYTLNAQFLPGQPYIATLSEDNVSWKVGADYRASDNTLIYANIARGYKAGSFPTFAASVQSALAPAKQEAVTSYELGTKARFAGGAVRLNSAVFYQEYDDKQVQGTVKDPLFGLLQQLQNVPKSHIFGVEADLTVKPFHGLTLVGSGSYLKTRVDQFEGIDTFGQQQNFAGDRLPFAPEWTLILDADYRTTLSNGGELFFGGTVNYRTDQDAYVGGSTIPVPASANARTLSPYPFVINGYTTTDARIGYTFPNKVVTVSAFGKNVFNTRYFNNIVSQNDIVVAQPGMPVTYGASVKLLFK